MGGALRGCALGVKGELLEAARVFTAAVACRLPTNKSCAKVEPFARRAASYLLRFATERGGLDGWMCSQGEPICRYLLGATVQGGGEGGGGGGIIRRRVPTYPSAFTTSIWRVVSEYGYTLRNFTVMPVLIIFFHFLSQRIWIYVANFILLFEPIIGLMPMITRSCC